MESHQCLFFPHAQQFWKITDRNKQQHIDGCRWISLSMWASNPNDQTKHAWKVKVLHCSPFSGTSLDALDSSLPFSGTSLDALDSSTEAFGVSS